MVPNHLDDLSYPWEFSLVNVQERRGTSEIVNKSNIYGPHHLTGQRHGLQRKLYENTGCYGNKSTAVSRGAQENEDWAGGRRYYVPDIWPGYCI